MRTRSPTLRPAFTACAAVLLAAGCRHVQAAPPAQNGDDVAIYRVVLATAQSRLVVNTTQPPPRFTGDPKQRITGLRARELPGLDTSTVRSFLAANRVSVPLPELDVPGVELVSETEWRAAIDDEEPRWIHGAMMLSRIGYSRDRSQALVYVIAACPRLCGGADYVLLVRGGGVWRVADEANDWNS